MVSDRVLENVLQVVQIAIQEGRDDQYRDSSSNPEDLRVVQIPFVASTEERNGTTDYDDGRVTEHPKLDFLVQGVTDLYSGTGIRDHLTPHRTDLP